MHRLRSAAPACAQETSCTPLLRSGAYGSGAVAEHHRLNASGFMKLSRTMRGKRFAHAFALVMDGSNQPLKGVWSVAGSSWLWLCTSLCEQAQCADSCWKKAFCCWGIQCSCILLLRDTVFLLISCLETEVCWPCKLLVSLARQLQLYEARKVAIFFIVKWEGEDSNKPKDNESKKLGGRQNQCLEVAWSTLLVMGCHSAHRLYCFTYGQSLKECTCLTLWVMPLKVLLHAHKKWKAVKMAQQRKASATKPKDLSSIPRTHCGKRKHYTYTPCCVFLWVCEHTCKG